jgi:hypothetical protein
VNGHPVDLACYFMLRLVSLLAISSDWSVVSQSATPTSMHTVSAPKTHRVEKSGTFGWSGRSGCHTSHADQTQPDCAIRARKFLFVDEAGMTVFFVEQRAVLAYG